MKRKNRTGSLKLLPLFFIFGLLLQACGSPTIAPGAVATNQISATPTATLPVRTATPAPLAPTATPVKYGADWQTRWLQKIPCAAPCWEGITPGLTTDDQVLDLLKASPILAEVVANKQYSLGGLNSVATARFSDKSGKKIPNAVIIYSNQSKIIQAIKPFYYQNFTFGEIIKAYGEPSHIILHGQPFEKNAQMDEYYLTFLYQPQGFALTMYTSSPVVGKFEITPDLLMDAPFFYDSKSVPLSDIGGMVGSDIGDLRPWEGFKGFEYYCNTAVYCRVT